MLIVFEWWEWAWKSTQIDLLKKHIEWLWKKVYITREPWWIWSKIAENIRELIKNKEYKEMSSLTEFFLFLASRSQHVEEIIKPKLKEWYTIISDRFFYSNLAYQHYARWLFTYKEAKDLNLIATQWINADLIIHLKIEPNVWLKRKWKEIKECRLDSESLNFHEKVKKWFEIVKENEKNWHTIDASKSIEEIFSEIKNIYKNYSDL